MSGRCSYVFGVWVLGCKRSGLQWASSFGHPASKFGNPSTIGDRYHLPYLPLHTLKNATFAFQSPLQLGLGS